MSAPKHLLYILIDRHHSDESPRTSESAENGILLDHGTKSNSSRKKSPLSKAASSITPKRSSYYEDGAEAQEKRDSDPSEEDLPLPVPLPKEFQTSLDHAPSLYSQPNSVAAAVSNINSGHFGHNQIHRVQSDPRGIRPMPAVPLSGSHINGHASMNSNYNTTANPSQSSSSSTTNTNTNALRSPPTLYRTPVGYVKVLPPVPLQREGSQQLGAPNPSSQGKKHSLILGVHAIQSQVSFFSYIHMHLQKHIYYTSYIIHTRIYLFQGRND